MTIDYAHTPHATQQRQVKAKTIARWCYHHGVTAAAIEQITPELRRRVAGSVGVHPPTENPDTLGETWRVVVELLHQRTVWDQANRQDPPVAPIDCVPCLVGRCSNHRDGRGCEWCGQPLHPVNIREGYATHPACHQDRPLEEPRPVPAPDDPQLPL